MDIKIPDSWLREYLTTKAPPAKIGECLSLCGPSVERIKKLGRDFVYEIEVTTNRVDSASVYGIAREAAAILPRFGIPAKLKHIPSQSNKFRFVKSVGYLNAKVDPNLCPRFTAVLIKNVKLGPSPKWLTDRLEASDIRGINNVVDISNYIMLLLGQPVHTFDYDKIKGAKMVLRESRAGENITTLDKKTFKLKGGDIIIEDGDRRIIDLAGIMGGDLSAVDANTKNVLLFVQTYNPVNIRRTAMSLAHRTQAATLFEKGTDPENVAPAMITGIDLFETLTGGRCDREILDIYPKPYKPSRVKTTLEFLSRGLGIAIKKQQVSEYLSSLGFECAWSGNTLEVSVPSFRAGDIKIPEDILEEVARIYGYHNLPSYLMEGAIPADVMSETFRFESTVKNILSGWGGVEVYTLSLVSSEFAGAGALKLKNPLGADGEYLRTSMMPSMMEAADRNSAWGKPFFLFEMANIYPPRKNNLPDETLVLAGIFSGFSYRNAKGVVESLLARLNIEAEFKAIDYKYFSPGKCLEILSGGVVLGKFGYLENSKLIYWEMDSSKLCSLYKPYKPFRDFPKYPPQIEDITLVLPQKTLVGELVKSAAESSKYISSFVLKDIYKDAYTFGVSYQNPDKTLTNTEVEKLRTKLIKDLKQKYGAVFRG